MRAGWLAAGWLVRRGMAAGRLVWWMASSWMGLAPRWLVGRRLGLARWRRACRVRRRKLLLELPLRWLWTRLLQCKLILHLRMGLLDQLAFSGNRLKAGI